MARWSAFVPELADGDRLVHTDLHSEQFIVAEHQVHVIDWSWRAAGAPWVDTAIMVLRLIWAGHSADAAEQWARARTTWADLDDKTITAFAVFTAGSWTDRHITFGVPGMDKQARLARNYAAWRLGRTTGNGRP
jgi:hypothetical protein